MGRTAEIIWLRKTLIRIRHFGRCAVGGAIQSGVFTGMPKMNKKFIVANKQKKLKLAYTSVKVEAIRIILASNEVKPKGIIHA